jgi:hypothetical protein
MNNLTLLISFKDSKVVRRFEEVSPKIVAQIARDDFPYMDGDQPYIVVSHKEGATRIYQHWVEGWDIV